MSKGLIITEKPSVAKDICEALGGFTAKNGGEYYEYLLSRYVNDSGRVVIRLL